MTPAWFRVFGTQQIVSCTLMVKVVSTSQPQTERKQDQQRLIRHRVSAKAIGSAVLKGGKNSSQVKLLSGTTADPRNLTKGWWWRLPNRCKRSNFGRMMHDDAWSNEEIAWFRPMTNRKCSSSTYARPQDQSWDLERGQRLCSLKPSPWAIAANRCRLQLVGSKTTQVTSWRGAQPL